MIRKVEATHAWIESLVYQSVKMPIRLLPLRLGAPVALCKAQSTRTFEFCAREAAQIFGGLAYTRGGQGEKVERLYREVRAFAIPGGSEGKEYTHLSQLQNRCLSIIYRNHAGLGYSSSSEGWHFYGCQNVVKHPINMFLLHENKSYFIMLQVVH